MHLVNEQATGDGEIQRVGRADHRDVDEVCAEATLNQREPLALLAQGEDGRPRIIEAVKVGRAIG